MKFHLIDRMNWNRRDCYEHFTTVAKSSYCITSNIDITELLVWIQQKNLRVYPTITWIVSKVINEHKEFKMGVNEQGELGVYEEVCPYYSVLNKETKNMDCLWNAYQSSFEGFYQEMVTSLEAFDRKPVGAIPPRNAFVVSCLPWINYTSFSVLNESGQTQLFPMVSWGRFVEQEKRKLLPMSFQIHHAVADGYHVSLFYQEVQELCEQPGTWITK